MTAGGWFAEGVAVSEAVAVALLGRKGGIEEGMVVGGARRIPKRIGTRCAIARQAGEFAPSEVRVERKGDTIDLAMVGGLRVAVDGIAFAAIGNAPSDFVGAHVRVVARQIHFEPVADPTQSAAHTQAVRLVGVFAQ